MSVAWQRSTRCDSNACVEVALRGEEVAMRDSKDPNGGTLLISRDTWKTFIAWLADDSKLS
jgi:hypothetical protein